MQPERNSNDGRSSNANDGVSPRGSSAKYVVLAACVFGLFVVIAIWLVSRSHELTTTQQTLLPILASGLSSGMLKLINIVQNRATDRKVTEDVATTKDVKKQLNGGLDDRIKGAVAKALAERQLAVAEPPPLPPTPTPPAAPTAAPPDPEADGRYVDRTKNP